ncbi:MAG: cytochrome b [Magnetococcales bacterium]|nr:cytochrome b [Magnetococcales bacterium]
MALETPGTNPIRYNGFARLLHWLMAALVLGLAALGFYMVTLTYYDPWYRTAPDLHRSFGVISFILVTVRWLWRKKQPPPAMSGSLKPMEKLAAHWVHHLLYGLLFILPISGYFITTAKGDAVNVFGLFTIPAIFTQQPIANLEDIAGFIHLGLAVCLLTLVALHIAGGLKHHFIDKDDTLTRML